MDPTPGRDSGLRRHRGCGVQLILSTDFVGKTGDVVPQFRCVARACGVVGRDGDFVGDAYGPRCEAKARSLLCSLRPTGSASLSQRPLQHSCCDASGLHQCQTPTAGQAQGARTRGQGMLAAQALRTEMRPAGRARMTAGLRAPPLARCAAELLGPGECARPPVLISQLWSRRTFPPAKRWQVSRQCRA